MESIETVRASGRLTAAVLWTLMLASQATAAAAPPRHVDRTELSRGGQGRQSSAGIDGAGRAVAVWVQRSGTDSVEDRIVSRAHPADQPWGPGQALSAPLGTVQNTPVVRVTPSGAAVAVWTDADGIWVAERPGHDHWLPGRLLVPGAAVSHFAMNDQGEAVLGWASGTRDAGATQLHVMRRDARGQWQPAEVVARAASQGSYVQMDDLSISDVSGDVLVAWERYQAQCPTACIRHGYVLHVSRAGREQAAWVDSGSLSGPSGWSHRARVAADRAGGAAVAFAMDYQGVMVSLQPSAREAWTAARTVHAALYAYLAGLSCDAQGQLTLAFLDDGGGMPQVMAKVGSLVTGLWAPAVSVSRDDLSVGQAVLGGSASGAAVLAWTSGDANFSNNVVRVAVRASATAPWRRPRTVSAAEDKQPVPEAVAVNPAGQAVVVFSSLDSGLTVQREFAVTNGL